MTRTRSVRARKPHPLQDNFEKYGKITISWVGVWFPRAQPRVQTSSAYQSILLIMEMILHTLIAIVALKAAEINR